MNNKQVIYIGEVDFSENRSAASLRILNNCKSIALNPGFDVKIIGYGNTSSLLFEGFQVFNVKRGKTLISKTFYYLLRSYFFIFLLARIASKNDIIVYYGTSTRILLPLFLFCKLKSFKIVVDVVEWYEYSHLPFGKFGPIALDVHFAMTFLIPKVDGLIVISSYLYNYYKEFECKSIIVPILVAANPFIERTYVSDRPIKIVYAGYAGKKDLIANVVKALEVINLHEVKIEFHILGMAGSDFQKEFGKAHPDYIFFYGVVGRDQVDCIYRNCDFSVLFRPIERFSMAGFPTKFVESLNFGVPVVGNYSSDLDRYLFNGYNGFVSKDGSIDEIIIVFKKLLSFDMKQHYLLRINSVFTVQKHFDYPNYSERFYSFFYHL